MRTQNSGPEIAKRFTVAVIRYFKPIEKRRLSRVISATHPGVRICRYANAVMYLEVRLGPPAYEPLLVFGEIGVDDQVGAFDLEIGDLVRAGKALPEARADITDPLERQVEWLSKVARDCLGEVLLGNLKNLPEMRSRRRIEIAAWKQDIQLQALREVADSAWRNKDFAKFAEVTRHAPFKDEPAMKKRLRLAERMPLPSEPDPKFS